MSDGAVGRSRHVPEPMTRDQLLEVLDDIRERVKIGDSFEGSVEYTMPDPDSEEDLSVEFMVVGAWRIGNLQGQGGMRMAGNWVDHDPWEEPGGSRTPEPVTTPSREVDWD